MKFTFSKISLPARAGLWAGFFSFISCRTGECFGDLYLPPLAIVFFLCILAAWLYGRCFRERFALRAERKRLVRLLAEQEKTLAMYRHQAEWLRREDVALLIEKKERLAACLLHQLEMVKQRKCTSGRHAGFSNAEWDELLALIDKVYDDFTVRLQTAYPSLTEDAIRFCCLLKTGFSLEEITCLLSVTKDAVYKRRSRLRRELLPDDDKRLLEEFLADF